MKRLAGLAIMLTARLPGTVAAQSPLRAGAALKLIDEQQCDAAVDLLTIDDPKEAIDRGATGVVEVRFDPRFARVMRLASSDRTGSTMPTAAPDPNRHDFERVLLASDADAIRVLARPPMSPNIDNAVEREVPFDRGAGSAAQPIGLQSPVR